MASDHIRLASDITKVPLESWFRSKEAGSFDIRHRAVINCPLLLLIALQTLTFLSLDYDYVLARITTYTLGNRNRERYTIIR